MNLTKLEYGPSKHAKKVIIFGSRDFTDFDLLKKKMDFYTKNWWDVWVISGGQKTRISWKELGGADYLGERWAALRRYTVTRFHPDIEKYGSPAAFHIRNKEMAEFAQGQYAVCFWDGKSKGTKRMIALCETYDIKLRVVRYEDK